MRRPAAVLAVLFALGTTSYALASGFGGENPPARIPIPARVFKAQIEDFGKTQVSLTSVTFAGEVFLYGYVGDAQVALPFEKIKEVRFSALNDDRRQAEVTLIDGSKQTLAVTHDLLWYGLATFGNYQIEVEKTAIVRF